MSSYHPRCEFREVKPDGTTKAAWNSGTGNHIMSGTSTITHLPADAEASGVPKPNVTFAQIHDTTDIPSGYTGGDIVRLQVETSSNTVSSLRIQSYTHSPNGAASTQVPTLLQASYTIGDPIDWKIEDLAGTCNIYIGGVLKKTITLNGPGCYFKAGCYPQFSTAVVNGGGSPDGGYLSTSYARVELKNLVVTHSPAL